MGETILDLLNNVQKDDTSNPNSRVLIIDGLNLYLRTFAVNGMLNDRGVPVHTEKIKVETVTWDTLVEKYNIQWVDYLKIDTEGHDWEILQSIDMNKIKPKIIKVEHKHSGKLREIVNYLHSHGYHVEEFYYDVMGFLK